MRLNIIPRRLYQGKMAHLSVVRHTRVFQLTVNNTMFSLNQKKPSFSERQRLQAPTGGRFVYFRGQKDLFSLFAETQKVFFDC